MSTKLLVLGLGNIILKDEGVGVHVANAIKERYTFSPDVEIVDGGTLGLDLLPLFEGREKILIIDAVYFGKDPGHIGVLHNDEIPSSLSAKLSVHHIGLADVLFAAKLKDLMPSEIALVGIQPEIIGEFGLEMTGTVKGKLEEMIDRALEILKGWNVTCVLRSPLGSSA